MPPISWCVFTSVWPFAQHKCLFRYMLDYADANANANAYAFVIFRLVQSIFEIKASSPTFSLNFCFSCSFSILIQSVCVFNNSQVPFLSFGIVVCTFDTNTINRDEAIAPKPKGTHTFYLYQYRKKIQFTILHYHKMP